MSSLDAVVLLIGHGSKMEMQSELIRKFAESIKEKGVFSDVFYAFMSINKPSIREALNEIARKGYSKVVAIPVFISHGHHTIKDIPRELGLPEGEKRGSIEINSSKIEIIYAEPIGFDRRVVDILLERGLEAVKMWE